MRSIILILLVAASFVPSASAAGNVQRASYEIGPDYAFEFPVPECDDAHVVCFSLSGAESSVAISIIDHTNLVLPVSRPIAAHVVMFGPTGFTSGILCGSGEIELIRPRTSVRVEIALAGVGACTWGPSAEEDPTANTVTGVPTRGEVVLKPRYESVPAADAIEPGCIGAEVAVCQFVRFDPSMTSIAADASTERASVGASVFKGYGFWGPITVADAHGANGASAWHAGVGASSYDHDEIPESTCACVGVWDGRGYGLIVSVGTFDMTGDGPSADDAFVQVGTRHTGVLYGWTAEGEPYVTIILD